MKTRSVEAALSCRLQGALARVQLSAAKRRTVNSARADLRGKELLAVANILRVDPRWLALGIPSPAGAMALREFSARVWDLPTDDVDFIEGLLGAIPEPDKGAGVCRYCLCTDAQGCGDCYWLDGAATICSACLESDEDGP